MHVIKDNLNQLDMALDKNKCCVDISASGDGYAIDVKTYSDEYCPFNMKITSDVFDISIDDRFAVGDVEHCDFDFKSVALSIASGNLIEREGRFLLLRRSFMELNIANEVNFYVYGRIKFLSSNRTHNYLSYVL